MEPKSSFRKKPCKEQRFISGALEEYIPLLAELRRGLQEIERENMVDNFPVAQMLHETFDEEDAELKRKRDKGFFFSCSDQRIKDRKFA
jgi:hypothetical protein